MLINRLIHRKRRIFTRRKQFKPLIRMSQFQNRESGQAYGAMVKLVTLATCNLAQWSMDFEGNLERIVRSIRIAKEKGARYRLGPELEVTGYGCEDHFLELDTYLHSWECIAEILKTDLTDDMLVDIGMPVIHRNVRYNCRVFILNRKIVLIRPKLCMADDGNYREKRWFTEWFHRNETEEHYLPYIIASITGQKTVPIGDACIAFSDTCLSTETCEELWTPNSPHINLGLSGVEIFANGSGSHHQLRKLDNRIELIKSATAKSGGVYLYSNQQCCDGGRLYFDGCALIVVNGNIVAQGSQFSMKEVEVITATVDLLDVRSYRGGINSRNVQAAQVEGVTRIDCPYQLTKGNILRKIDPPKQAFYYDPMEEIALGPACWLWDYLRRSGMKGFFLPLSGGADSSATAAIVGFMCHRVFMEINNGNEQVLLDLRRIAGYNGDEMPESPQEIASRIFFTCYMGTNNSSEETANRARIIAEDIGATHQQIKIDDMTDSIVDIFSQSSGKTPKFKVNGGSQTENLALQNIQARSRMVLSYYYAQLLLWSRDKYGSLLVLGSANVDEALRGYLTKYDCSSADLNPIGGISKSDLKSFLLWAASTFPSMELVAKATPTAELEPITSDHVQTDEEDMGMSYEELTVFGRLRKIDKCGPLSMFEILARRWDHLPPTVVAEKVKFFFRMYSINRHKMTTLTPSYHACNYSPDDNRYDLRQFLYRTSWPWQFKKIDEMALVLEGEQAKL
eukprot:TRINITY_DN8375_c0_g1_i1.p1 TRINITY_DN8375_c0_g1~~TRINITY_DN8375_c0_g1_i1.p1  ORF type:complete len:738 (-),score=143.11 TRINITY_DN8375_c0_g1_i1:13-2226(-)